jgi:hypothetical protein
LLTEVGLTGLKAGDHADDAIEQGSALTHANCYPSS